MKLTAHFVLLLSVSALPTGSSSRQKCVADCYLWCVGFALDPCCVTGYEVEAQKGKW